MPCDVTQMALAADRRAITRILDRLEKAELVRRGRDSNDGRKVIVRLTEGTDEMHKVRSILDSAGKTWDEMASRYDEEAQLMRGKGITKAGQWNIHTFHLTYSSSSSLSNGTRWISISRLIRRTRLMVEPRSNSSQRLRAG